jgi:hypothetical protein
VPQDVLRVVMEVGVDLGGVFSHVHRPGQLPVGARGCGIRVTTAQDQQVGDRVGTCGATVRTGGQTQRADQVRGLGDLRRAAGFAASIVYRDVSTATSPPGRVNATDLTMKWLCREWLPWLCCGS